MKFTLQTTGSPSHQVNTPEASIPQGHKKSRLQAVQNVRFAPSAEGTPYQSEDELDDLPDDNNGTKRLVRKGQG